MQAKNRLIGSVEMIVKDFKLAWCTLLAVVAPSFIVVLLTGRYPFVVDLLADSRATLWGVFTSIFVHNGFWNGFVPNAEFMALLVIYFVVTNLGVAADVRRSRSRFFLYVTFISAISANAIWIVLFPMTSFGASGAIYSSEGVMLAFALTNALHLKMNPSKLLATRFRPSEKRLAITGFFTSLLISCFFICLLLIDTKLFLASGPHINVLVHGLGFYAAFLSTLVYHHRKESADMLESAASRKIVN
jgi:membrane associated rhomboid family serine protease